MRTILERKRRLDGSVVEWHCDLLALEPERYAAVRYVVPAASALSGSDLVLPAGAVTIGHFWADRPYTAYHFLAGELTLAVYCSIVESVEVGPELIAYRDLAVDLLIRPDGSATVLDEDELASGIEPETLETIEAAVAALRADPPGLFAGVEAATRVALASQLHDSPQ